jgi:hypothetical protein
VANVIHDIQLDELAGQKPQSPLRAPFRRLAASQSDEVRFLPAFEERLSAWPRPFVESTLQAFLREPLADMGDRPRTHTHSARYVFVFLAVICRQ